MSHSSRGLAAVGLTLIAAAGYLVSRLVLQVPHQSSPARAAGRRRAPTDRGTTYSAETASSVAEVRRPSAGAVAAAANYLQLIDGSGPEADRMAGLRAVTTAPFTARALAAVPVVARLRARVSAAGPAVIEGWSLGWRVSSSTSTHAQVQIWTMGIVVGPAAFVAPDWSTTTCTLVWSDGAWRVAAALTAAGPTPPGPDSSRSQATAFARAASRFEAFGDAS
jgi:hypothetical protein